ncbi:MAG: exodeoxyribonuclease VII small subunit [Alphaproteobacteria bacterium]
MAETETHKDIAEMSFEDALDELKDIVATLESGDGKLDAAIASYERGARLKQYCEKKLKEAQVKIDKIRLGPDGDIASEPFDAD